MAGANLYERERPCSEGPSAHGHLQGSLQRWDHFVATDSRQENLPGIAFFEMRFLVPEEMQCVDVNLTSLLQCVGRWLWEYCKDRPRRRFVVHRYKGNDRKIKAGGGEMYTQRSLDLHAHLHSNWHKLAQICRFFCTWTPWGEILKAGQKSLENKEYFNVGTELKNKVASSEALSAELGKIIWDLSTLYTMTNL